MMETTREAAREPALRAAIARKHGSVPNFFVYPQFERTVYNDWE